MPRILSVLLLLFLLPCHLQAQLKVYPVQRNHALDIFLKQHPDYTWNKPSKLAKTAHFDTLDLPFFEDFSQDFPYPDSSRWQTNHVYVNFDLAIKPPSIGVASFDNLNSQGNPYGTINEGVTSRSDTLLSQWINLKSYLNSGFPVDYTLADSILLSFFYQAQGVSSDKLDPTDSLVLEFRKRDGSWRRVWRSPGLTQQAFKQAYARIDDTAYLYEVFQFRFINYARNTGFSNLWHLDYIRMDRDRSVFNLAIKDVAISEKPTSLLKFYHSMPWNQFIANPNAERAARHSYRVRNNDTVVANVSYQFSAYNKFGTLLHRDQFINNNSNILRESDTAYGFNSFNFDSLSEPVIITKTYQVQNIANNNEPVNDQFTSTQVFNNYIAYDDGTAEDGLGLDYGSLPSNSIGKVAVRFRLNVADTLRGAMVYFNQSLSDVSMKYFNLMVWQNVVEGGFNEVVIRRLNSLQPVYTDSLNGYHLFKFDSLTILPPGEFFIGWQQSNKYILNVGLDRNYKVDGVDVVNDNLFYNILGTWEKADIHGAPMIRAVLGPALPDPLSIQENKPELSISLYPNPCKGKISFNSAKEFTAYSVIDLSGKELISNSLDGNSIDVSALGNGLYFLQLKDWNGMTVTAKFILNQ